MLILTEDREFAEFSLREGCIAVPFSVSFAFEKSEPEILVYEPFRELAEEFAEQFAQDPFSGEAVGFLKEQLSLPMRSHGFQLAKDIDKRICAYRLKGVADVNSDAVLPGTVLLSGKDDMSSYKNATTHELDMDPENPDDITAAVIMDDTIVAYATVNDLFEAENEVEISVECAKDFRRRGFATSAAARLSLELLKRGFFVSYKCRHTNVASRKVAEKAGFSVAGMEYNFVCYRNTASGE